MNHELLLVSVGVLIIADMILTYFTYNVSNKELKNLEFVTEKRIYKLRHEIAKLQAEYLKLESVTKCHELKNVTKRHGLNGQKLESNSEEHGQKLGLK